MLNCLFFYYNSSAETNSFSAECIFTHFEITFDQLIPKSLFIDSNHIPISWPANNSIHKGEHLGRLNEVRPNEWIPIPTIECHFDALITLEITNGHQGNHQDFKLSRNKLLASIL